MRFVNREAELKTVTLDLDTPRPSLFVLYGRRRTGKTALLRKAVEARRSVFFTADLGSRRDHLASFSMAVSEGLGGEGLEGAEFQSWEQALRFCARRAQEQPLGLTCFEPSLEAPHRSTSEHRSPIPRPDHRALSTDHCLPVSSSGRRRAWRRPRPGGG